VEAAPSRQQPPFARYEHLALQWQPRQRSDRLFSVLAAVALIAALLLGVWMSSIKVEKKPRQERVAVPERVAQFIRQQAPKPPPPPPPEPKPRPPEPKPAEPKPEVPRVERERPRPQQPLTEQQQQARERAQRSGLLAHMNELRDLMDTPQVTAQLSADLRTTEGARQATGLDTGVLTANATRRSGGVDGSQYATRAGSAALEAAELASAQAVLDAGSEAFARTDNAAARAGSSRVRSEEEITLVFDRHKSQLQSLYNRARRTNPTLKGKLVLAVTIAPDGSVTGVKVVSSELKDQSLIDSLLGRIRGFQFGARDVDVITVNYPIEFLPY
jgi:protein TonB